MKLGSLLVAMFALLILSSGCTTSRVDFDRQADTAFDAGAVAAILLSSDSSLEREAATSIMSSLQKAKVKVRIMALEDWRHGIFYWGFPENDDERMNYFTLLAGEPVIRRRITEAGLRYVIWVLGATEQKGQPVALAGGGMGGFVSVFGFFWDRYSRLQAWIFDFEQRVELGTIRALGEGHPWFLCPGLGPFCLPIGAAAFTEATACSGLAEAVVTFLTGADAPKPASGVNRALE
jgi:hypothetical protein